MRDLRALARKGQYPTLTWEELKKLDIGTPLWMPSFIKESDDTGYVLKGEPQVHELAVTVLFRKMRHAYPYADVNAHGQTVVSSEHFYELTEELVAKYPIRLANRRQVKDAHREYLENHLAAVYTMLDDMEEWVEVLRYRMMKRHMPIPERSKKRKT